MSHNWFCVIGGKKYGPLPAAKLKELALAGRLSPSDLVWREGIENWVPAQTLKGLYADTPAASSAESPDSETMNHRLPQEDLKVCPFCSEHVIASAKKCKHCGETLDVTLRAWEENLRFAEHQTQLRRSEPRPKWNTVRPFVVIGTLMMIFGAITSFGFFTMDTTVEVPVREVFGQEIGGGRVHNLGLMYQQQNGLIVSLGVCALGLVLAIVGRKK